MFEDIISAGEERLMFNAFFRKHFAFRQGDLAPVFKPLPSDIVLPAGSLIHVVDNMYSRDNSLPLSDAPNMRIPLIANDTYRKFVHHRIAIDTDGPVKIDEKYVFRTQNLAQNLKQFRSWTTKQKNLRVVENLKDLPTTQTTLAIINHNPLFRTVVRGMLPNYRQFKIIFSSILNTAAKCPSDRTQYIVIPLSKQMYNRSDFFLAKKQETPSAIKSKNSYHYFFMMHWLNFLDVATDLSLFESYPEDRWGNTVIVFTYGVDEMKYAMFWTLHDAIALNQQNRGYNKIVNQLNAFVLTNMGVELENTDNELQVEGKLAEVVDKGQVVSDTPDTEVVAMGPKDDQETELSDDPQDIEEDVALSEKIKAMFSDLTNVKALDPEIAPIKMGGLAYAEGEEDTPIQYTKPKKTEGKSNPTETENNPDFAQEKPEQMRVISDEIEEDAETQEVGVLSKITPVTTPEQISEMGKAHLQEIDEKVEELLRKDPNLTPKAKERLLRISANSKQVKLNGKTIEEHLTESVDPTLTSQTLDHLTDQLADPSMANASIQSFDQLYMEKFYHRDLAAVAVGLNSHGMFLTGIEEVVQSDELNRLVHYKMKFVDKNGKSHKLQFSLPQVDKNGNCLVNGVECKLRKQMTNLPICKVSPTRVSLASSFNKTVVERNLAKAHSFLPYFQKLMSMAAKNKEGSETGAALTEVDYGSVKINDRISTEYADIATLYKSFTLVCKNSDTYRFVLDVNAYRTEVYQFSGQSNVYSEKNITTLAEKYGTPFGLCKIGGEKYLLFIRANNIVTMISCKAVNVKGLTSKDIVAHRTTIIDMFSAIIGKPSTRLTEWTDIKILDKKFPVGFLLCFQFGLKHMLNYLGVRYKRTGVRSRQGLRASDIVIPFKDETLIIPRYPLRNSLIVTGLTMFNTKKYMFEDFNEKNVYYELLTDKGFKTNYLKGIEDTFKYFVDHKTKETLIQMGEPTTFKDLLIRATDMLCTPRHLESSAIGNHRLRSYERFNMIVYNEVMREHANFSRRQGAGATFSINPNAVLQRLLQDQAMIGIENINPIQESKINCSFTYTGAGGRTSQAFVTEDRRYPSDGMGVISEATPDSGSVAINAVAPPDPTIANIYGLVDPKPVKELEPAQILSTPALLLPGVTQDD